MEPLSPLKGLIAQLEDLPVNKAECDVVNDSDLHLNGRISVCT